ncbi:MFS transporter [Marivivens marinus]|uniref:MFS transporter n=1 Tax=Marivivens marinus TaxID=3110173 RepID=UPI003B84A01D
MKIGIASLIAGYVLSQFYRAFLAVLAPALEADIGATPEDLAFASGLWFLIFAGFQIPVGAALDRVGPRMTATVLLAIGGAGGAVLFAMAQSPLHISLAMALIGIGCSPVLMASYFIFARVYSPAVFATLAGMTIGIGSLGNIFSAAPMAWAVGLFGWRETVMGIAALTLLVALIIWATVKDPEKVVSTAKGSVLTLLAMPALWPIFIMMLVNYAPSAGLRGLWVAPYARDVFAADVGTIGTVTLIMGLAMIAGNFAYGPMDRIFGTRKWVIFAGNALGAVACLALYAMPDRGLWVSVALLALVGFAGASFPMLVAHAKAFFPAHLTGRGVTLINLFGVGGVGLFQFVTRPIYAASADGAQTAAEPYAALFLFAGLALVVGLAVYLLSQDRTD